MARRYVKITNFITDTLLQDKHLELTIMTDILSTTNLSMQDTPVSLQAQWQYIKNRYDRDLSKFLTYSYIQNSCRDLNPRRTNNSLDIRKSLLAAELYNVCFLLKVLEHMRNLHSKGKAYSIEHKIPTDMSIWKRVLNNIAEDELKTQSSSYIADFVYFFTPRFHGHFLVTERKIPIS